VRQIDVPWAEEGSRFTALFEALVIDWLAEASIQAVAQRLGLSWSAVDGIMQPAVKRGLARRDPVASSALAWMKRPTRNATATSPWSATAAASCMWPPYIRAVKNHLPHGARKIAFDRFHVAKQFNEAVDLVRRKEHKALAKTGDQRLKGTKYHWLRGGGPRKAAEQERFD
jgi:transposase